MRYKELSAVTHADEQTVAADQQVIEPLPVIDIYAEEVRAEVLADGANYRFECLTPYRDTDGKMYKRIVARIVVPAIALNAMIQVATDLVSTPLIQ